MTRLKLAGSMVSLLVLAACQHSSGPAPIYDGGSGEPRPLGPASAVPVSQAGILETAGGRVTVQPGETLYAISRRSGVPVRSLIDANNLQPPYRVQAGQVLILPSTRQHIVQQGETLYAVARRYNVEAASLARMNHIDPPYTIKLGQPLLLPPSVAEGSQVAAAPPTSALSPPGVVPALPPASVPTAATAPAAGVTTTALPPPTPTGPPQALAPQASPPQTLPPPATAPAPPPVPPRPPAQPTPPAPESADEAPPPAGTAVSPPEPESGVPPPAVPPGPKAAPSAAVAALVEGHRAPVAPLFSWPVSGQIVSTFGPAAGGTHNDGINVSAPEGTTVVAAEAGTIAYAGNELRGFGNLLLIKHDGGWVTAYAHNQVLLVKKGDRVRRGQAIARVGSTGGVSGPQLHFELRNGTKAVDPLDHLPQLTAGD